MRVLPHWAAAAPLAQRGGGGKRSRSQGHATGGILIKKSFNSYTPHTLQAGWADIAADRLGSTRRLRSLPSSCCPPPLDLVSPPMGSPPRLPGLRDASWRLLATALLLTWLRSLQIDAILLPMAPQMEPNWVPNLPDFPKCENLDFGDPSHSLEGPRVSDLNQFAPQI